MEKEYMKLAMLKHEETFRHQVSELHRLYRIQKLLMKDIDNPRNSKNPNHQQQQCLNFSSRVSEIEDEDDDASNLELTLGPSLSRNHYQKKFRGSEGGEAGSDSGTTTTTTSFSSSSSTTGSNNINGKKKEQNWGLEMSIQNNNNNNNNPWILQALSLNLT